MAVAAREQNEAAPSPSLSPSDDRRQKARALAWQEALTSLWAPISIFGLAFLLYLLVVELHTPSFQWAQPVLKGFALLMLGYFGVLLVYRTALPKPKRLRELRHHARELANETRALLERHDGKLEAARPKLLEQLEVVEGLRLSGEADKLEAELEKLTQLTDKHLAVFRRHPMVDFVSGLVKALGIALIIRTVVLEPFKIPSGSMIPTLEVGDQIFVNKYIYGVRVPWLNWVPFRIVRAPQRGDVIVFENPVDSSKDFIKRVIGLPGDKVEIVDDRLVLNGVPQERTLLDPRHTYWDLRESGSWQPLEAALYRETVDGRSHRTLHRPELAAFGGREGPYVVPPDHVFVMGDNRDNSLDSRYGFRSGGGVEYVPYGHIKGKAMVIWLSLSHDGLGSSLFGGTGLRTDRLFLPVR